MSLRIISLTLAQLINYACSIPISLLVIKYVPTSSLAVIIYSQAIASIAAIITNSDFDYADTSPNAIADFGGIQAFSNYLRVKSACIWSAVSLVSIALLYGEASRSIPSFFLVLFSYIGSASSILIQNSLLVYFSLEKLFLYLVTLFRLVSLGMLIAHCNNPDFSLLYAFIVALSQLIPAIMLYLIEVCIVNKSKEHSSVAATNCEIHPKFSSISMILSRSISKLKNYKQLLGLVPFNVLWQLVLISPSLILPFANNQPILSRQLILYDRLVRPAYSLSNIFFYSICKHYSLSPLVFKKKFNRVSHLLFLLAFVAALILAYTAFHKLVVFLMPDYTSNQSIWSASFALLFVSIVLIPLSSLAHNLGLLSRFNLLSWFRSYSEACQIFLFFSALTCALLVCIEGLSVSISLYLVFCSSFPLLKYYRAAFR